MNPENHPERSKSGKFLVIAGSLIAMACAWDLAYGWGIHRPESDREVLAAVGALAGFFTAAAGRLIGSN